MSRPHTGPFSLAMNHRVIDCERRDTPSCSWWTLDLGSRERFMQRAAQEAERMKGSRGAVWAQSLQSDGAEAWAVRKRA